MWYRLGVVCAMLLGAGLRVWQINHFGYNSDEAVYAGQAAAIAHDSALAPYFPAFRAHPLLFQTLLAPVFSLHLSDLFPRLISAAVGVATIPLVYLTGAKLYDRRVGLAAALFIAVMPYHVVVTRQVLLDGPMTFCATLALYLIACYAVSGRPVLLYATGAAMGLTLIAKEPGVLMLGAIYAFLALSSTIKVRLRDLAIALGLMVLIASAYPLSLMIAGHSKTGGNFLSWQLFRRPNHSLLFYATEVPRAMGLLVVAVAVLGFVVHRKRRSWREILLVCWIVVPVAFFELWPVKGFQYLLPVAPPVAILAARALLWWPKGLTWRLAGHRLAAVQVGAAATAIVALTLLVPTWNRIQPADAQTFLAGSGGVPGGREAGHWIDAHVPVGAQMLTIGPSMANILEYYGHRQAYGLSVSPNPLHRNPVYVPIPNPDQAIRDNDLQYLVWDAFSAARTTHFASQLMGYVDKYNGRPIHSEAVRVRTKSGATASVDVIRIYTVRP